MFGFQEVFYCYVVFGEWMVFVEEVYIVLFEQFVLEEFCFQIWQKVNGEVYVVGFYFIVQCVGMVVYCIDGDFRCVFFQVVYQIGQKVDFVNVCYCDGEGVCVCFGVEFGCGVE